MDDFTLFYAWQSDTPQKAGRYLIRDAAKDALDRLAKDAIINDSPRLDSDTQQVAGTPEIANTIFNKIDACGLFLADVTFVGSTAPDDGDPKMLPNPNVLLELGYATAKVGWERVILVMNHAYGTPDDLMFDLRHRRWPLTFEVANINNDLIKEQRSKLSKNLELAIRAAMQAEHASVANVVSRLDVNCVRWMHNAGKLDYFQSPSAKYNGQSRGQSSPR